MRHAEELERPEAAWRLLAQAHGLGPDDVKIIRQIVYTFEARIARRWRDRRVFLAGDAAHTMPPYLGQGACSGIRDSANLAWKLDLVLRGLAGDSLLDSYEVERRPHTTVITQMAMGLGAIANMHDPEAAAQRDAAPSRPARCRRPRPCPRSATAFCTASLTAPSSRRSADWCRRAASAPGTGAGRLDNIVGRGFALITTVDAAAALSDEQRSFLGQIGCHVVRLGCDVIDTDGVHTAYLRELGAVGYLARPDFVLFGAAADPAGLSALVDELITVTGWSAAPATAGA